MYEVSRSPSMCISGDLSTRRIRPEIRVKSIQFSPTGKVANCLSVLCSNLSLCVTGQSWAAVTTEGLLVYTLDTGLVFDPLDLAEEVTPEAAREAVAQKRFSVALAMSLRLCDRELVARVVETVPSSDGGYYFPHLMSSCCYSLKSIGNWIVPMFRAS